MCSVVITVERGGSLMGIPLLLFFWLMPYPQDVNTWICIFDLAYGILTPETLPDRTLPRDPSHIRRMWLMVPICRTNALITRKTNT